MKTVKTAIERKPWILLLFVFALGFIMAYYGLYLQKF
jgi:hypothetical protein